MSPGGTADTGGRECDEHEPSGPDRRMTLLPLSAPVAGGWVGLVDGTEVRLLTVTGETIAVGDAPGFQVNDSSRPIEARIEGASVALQTATTVRAWAGAPFAQDCTGPRSEQRGRSVAFAVLAHGRPTGSTWRIMAESVR